MRVIAGNVEYFDLMRDKVPLHGTPEASQPSSPLEGLPENHQTDRGLKDSLWYFDGDQIQCWPDVEDLVQTISNDKERELPKPIAISTDFYPSSILLDRGIVLGIDADLVQRRDMHFAFFRYSIRVSLRAISYLRLCLPSPDATYLTPDPPPLHHLVRLCSSIQPVTPIPAAALLSPCSGGSASQCTRRRGGYVSTARRCVIAISPILPLVIPRLSRHSRPMHPQNRAPVLAYSVHSPASSAGALRSIIREGSPQDSWRLPPRFAQL